MKRLLLAMAGLMLALPVMAKDINAKLYLADIKAVQVQEISGDELYFDVAEYGRRGLQQFYRVPESPVHLLSRYLDKVKDLRLWRGTLKEGESIQLIVSLLEEDSPPWDLDDLIGIVKISMKNNKGKLEASFVLPNSNVKSEQVKHNQGVVEKLNLAGEGAFYDIRLSLKS